ncbi:quaternary amine ABC transporter ATP-binding protein [Crassaminicella profunda]|uniref:quaternary amine ABC transporter ATP-binding protein n=1 Tax=Crassaminicella profunda TaxID=1286698 RepID=UPI001CA717C3|nr:glycine betaine/L-proline ABC transporter ATP-binding protein [Crassaminicella profunda]QZY54706.1 glycine betaine/L-proline ABC transporter ATP-binding protein [Crassaminicella profunda]
MAVKIEVKNLTKIFGRNPKGVLKKLKKGMTKEEILEKTGHAVGVNNVSFPVNEGEIFVIMGLSGSGKSTLIRCLNLLNKPTSGKILFEGKDIVKFKKEELRGFRQNNIAMVFQHFGLFSHKTVVENVAYGLEVKGIPKEERLKIANDTLETVGLGGWGEKMPHELSGGMQQRVGLARALANNPDILLMDEPFSALDPLIRRDMQLELLDIQAKLKKTIIFITHDVNEAFKLGDRVAVMKDGEVEQIGTPEEILAEPANEYIEDFIQDIDRSKILQAKHVMFKPSPLLFNKDGLKVAVKEMKSHGISSIFVVNKERILQGIITIDDVVKAIQEKRTLQDIIKQDYFKTDPETYVQELIPMATETKYPIAVVDEKEKLLGITVRTSVLSGLVS